MLEIEAKSFYLQFKSSFPNPQSKSHHKIVLLFKFRESIETNGFTNCFMGGIQHQGLDISKNKRSQRRPIIE